MIGLGASGRQTLQHRSNRDLDWRAREWAQSLLLLAAGQTCTQVAVRQGMTLQTVSATRRRWLDYGRSGLPDRPRCGGPAKLTPAETEHPPTWARQKPLTLTALQARHEAAGETPVHINTLTGVLKRGGFVWKRTHHRLKNRDDVKFEEAKREITALRPQAAAGKIVLAYLD